MLSCFFISDLHGFPNRYNKLFEIIRLEQPFAVFLGGDLLPSILNQGSSDNSSNEDFVSGFLLPKLETLKKSLGSAFPKIFVILGNDDPKIEEQRVLDLETKGLWTYVHNRSISLPPYLIFGYANVPPSPFLLKDWERYDVSRYVDPGCVSPEEGYRTVSPSEDTNIRYETIKNDLEQLKGDQNLDHSVFLFHAPPYRTNLDRAALDGRMVDHVPLDVHVGSIAIKRFIEERQPLLTLHGHIHESARITGQWKDQIGRTILLSAAHDGPELALVRFDLQNPKLAKREIIPLDGPS